MNRRAFEVLAAHYGSEQIAAILEPYVSERRRARIEASLDGRLASVEVAIERPYDPHNAAAVVRSAEALGAWAVHVIEASEKILRARGTTTGTHHWIETRHHRDLDAFVAEQRDRGMRVVGACVDATHMLEELPVDRPLCLLLGNEHAGLSAAAQAACELRYRIPIYGLAESYNLSVAAALSLDSVTRRRRALLGHAGDLDATQRAFERARAYYRSVDPRHAKAAFPVPAPAAVEPPNK